MREALQLLSELTREDLDWLFFAGHERQITADAQIMIEGQYPDALYFVLQGLLGIRSEALGDSTLIHLGPGEILGEMSLLEGKPASATVLAVEDSLLLVLPVDALRRELRRESPLGRSLLPRAGQNRLRPPARQHGQAGTGAAGSRRGRGARKQSVGRNVGPH